MIHRAKQAEIWLWISFCIHSPHRVIVYGYGSASFTPRRRQRSTGATGIRLPPTDQWPAKRQAQPVRDPALFPNIALLRVPVPLQDVLAALESVQRQRAVLDAVDLIIRWLAFVWGVSRSGNSLLEGYGMPSAAMLKIICGVVGYDLTPGLESRASCPEAIWQAAKWWHGYYEEQNRLALAGAFHIGHAL